MTALIHPGTSPYFDFAIETPGRSARFNLQGPQAGIALAIGRRTLVVEVAGPQGDVAERVEVGLAGIESELPADAFRLSLETGHDGRRFMVLSRGGAIVLSKETGFDLHEGVTIGTSNVVMLSAQCERYSIGGLVSAPLGENTLCLIDAPQDLVGAICGALEEQAGQHTKIRILGRDDVDDPYDRTIGRDEVERNLQDGTGGQISNLVLVSFNGTDHLEPEDIPNVIDECPDNGIRLCLGGVIQKISAGDFGGFLDGPIPLCLSKGNTLPPLSFARGAWQNTVPVELRDGFQVTVPNGVAQVSADVAPEIQQEPVSSVFWKLDRRWTIPDWDEPEDGKFGFAWLLETVFGFDGTNMATVADRLRAVHRACRKDGIRLLSSLLLPKDRTSEGRQIHVLVDSGLVALACDATYSRGQRPLATYLQAIEEKSCASRVLETDRHRIVLVYRPDVDTADAGALDMLLHNVAAALAKGLEPGQPTARMQTYLEACRDVVAVGGAVNEVAGGNGFDLQPGTLIRFLERHPELVVPMVALVLRNAAPNTIRSFMRGLNGLDLDLPLGDRQTLQSVLIDARVLIDADERFWEGLEEQPYDARRWAGLQAAEQLPWPEFAETRLRLLEHLDLESADKAFGEVLYLLKQGRIIDAVARGRDAVLQGELNPENEQDILAIAILADDFKTAEVVKAALAQPLSELDHVYLTGCLAARMGCLKSQDRIDCTRDILALDPDFAELKVANRSYQQLADFATQPVPDRDVICVITAKNEEVRLRETMAYHHAIGIRHFILIDNMSSDGTLDLAREYGAKIIQTAESYKTSRYGMAWVNDVLDRYCNGFWSLVVDADEMFVFPQAETLPIADFANRLEQNGFDAFTCLLLDMYPDAPIASFRDIPKGELRNKYRFFDAGNYAFWPRLRSPLMGISGGVRDRIFRIGRFAHLAPIAHTKTPLVKWQKGLKYLTSTHDTTPVRSPLCYGVLEHYKYTPDFVLRAKREVIRKEHWDGGSEYSAYASVLEADPDMSFMEARFTRERQDSTRLIEQVCPFHWPESLLAD